MSSESESALGFCGFLEGGLDRDRKLRRGEQRALDCEIMSGSDCSRGYEQIRTARGNNEQAMNNKYSTKGHCYKVSVGAINKLRNYLYSEDQGIVRKR